MSVKESKNKIFRDQELELKRQKHREWLVKNPPIFDENTGQEMKECQGCYCQMVANCLYDFCFDCLDGESDCCVEREENTSKCLACYGKKSRFKTDKTRKKLTFTQKQRLYWELMKQTAEDRIEEIKDFEDVDDMRTAQAIENMKRWSQQERQRILKYLSREEICSELERRKSFHKKEVKECWECHKKTNDWEHEYDDNYQCRDCYNDLVADNKKWTEKARKEKIECSSCGKNKLFWNYGSKGVSYCKDCWEFVKEKDKECYEWCAENCLFKKIKSEKYQPRKFDSKQ